jgi:membrane protease YdiL (CAAX protease family)
MKAGALAVAIGLPLLGFGIFMMGDRSGQLTRPAYFLGLVLLLLGVARLSWSGWHGNGVAWLVAAPAAAILTWALYELIRQGVPLYGIGIYGTMTAPILSAGVGLGILVVGWLRRGRTTSDVRAR